MMRRDSAVRVFIGLYAPALLTFFCVSCATRRDTRELRDELSRLGSMTESRLSSIEYSMASLDSLLREQHALSQGIRALLSSQSQDTHDAIMSIMARQDEINYQIRDLLNTLQTIQAYGGISPQEKGQPASPQPSPPGAPGTSPPTDTMTGRTPSAIVKVKPEDIFKSAVDDINNGNYALAESRLLMFILQFPDHDLAGNAQYWLGEAVFNQKKFDLAVSEYDKVITNYKKSPKVPAAYLKKALAQIELGQGKNAETTLKKLINSYPKSEEARTAKKKLAELQ